VTERKSSVTSWEGILVAGLGKGLEWRRSSWCNGGTCLEAAVQDDAILVQSSADPDGPILTLSSIAWRDLIISIKRMS
jgi:hypothetical protein